ncbi:Protein phosphatase 2C family protein [Perilla frutescens var. frutescens]|nr:Protein phosphatase 2C family protein [Perilla frutescens var. frutescens]
MAMMVGVYSLKGKKKFMEDSYKVFASANGDKRLFGVYDGHGGSNAAAFVAENLHLKIFEMLETTSEDKAKEATCKGLDSGACCVTALIEGREMVVSNLGDCRAVMCRGGGAAEALTADHRPTHSSRNLESSWNTCNFKKHWRCSSQRLGNDRTGYESHMFDTRYAISGPSI